MQDIRQKLLATFEIEHRDHVEQIRALLVALTQSGEPATGSALEEMFRRAHSLKGAARAVDLHPIEGLAHRLETLFSRVRRGTCPLSPDITGVAQQVLDASEDCLAAFAGNRISESVALALEAVDRVLAGTGGEPPKRREPVEQPAIPAFQPVEVVKITSQNFEGLFRSAAGLVSETQRQNQVTERLNRLAQDVALLEKEGDRIRRPARAESVQSLEHQVLLIARQVKAVRRLHQRSAWTLRRLGLELQHDIRQARMIPAEVLVEGNRRMVRDLARDLGKEVDFRATCTGVHADRRVLEALKDPVMHLLRNALIHGIESPAERRTKGKGPAGVLTLRVEIHGQRLSVTVEDDGRGVDRERVAETAAREGLLPAVGSEHWSDREWNHLLFRPGFSTAPEVTNLSGRGMGLSVVYEAGRRLHGEVDIQRSPHGGTAISLSVPLSISVHRLILASSGGTLFALPVAGVERVCRVAPADVRTAEGNSVLTLGGELVPVSNIQGLLGLGYTLPPADRKHWQTVVIRSGAGRVAAVVDQLHGEVEAVIQDLGPAAGCGGKISSGVALDDGTIALVVNPADLVQGATQIGKVRPQAAVPATEPRRPAPPSSILIVDDSLTTRTLEKSILEAQGYRVRIAVDGVDALARLRQERADLVIADVEMPRLSGFGLLEAMKSDPELDRIPVIIVTSLERREDQQRGLALGADAYIVKQRFDQDDLLTVIRQIL